MAVRSIVSVDIEDEKLQNLVKLYEKYSTALAKAPGMWGDVNAEVAKSRKGFEAIAAAMLAQNELVRSEHEALKRTRSETERISLNWRNIARNTKSVATDIKDVTKTIIKWGAIAGVGGLIGAGTGLFGLERLAEGAASTRKTSRRLGISYGEQKAFATNYERLFGDPQGFLSSVAGAQTDVSHRVGLRALGFSEGEINSLSAAELADRAIPKIKQLADRTNPAVYQQTLRAQRLDSILTPEDLRSFHGLSNTEIAELRKGYRGNRGGFDVEPKFQKAWDDLSTALERAGKGIENTFVVGLAPLAPNLEKLSVGFTGLVQAFLQSDTLKGWIGDLDKALGSFAKEIGTPEFKKNVEDFARDIGIVAAQIAKAIEWLASWFPSGGSSSGAGSGTAPDGTPEHPRLFHGPLLGPIFGGVDGAAHRMNYGGGRWNGVVPEDTNIPAATQNAGIQSERGQWAAEIAADPRKKLEVAAMMDLEGSPLPTAESMFNRLAFQKSRGKDMTIEDMLHSGFYGPINRGSLPGRMTTLARNPKRLQQLFGDIDKVMAGSDVIKGYTDQGMLSDPNGQWPGMMIGGNKFTDWATGNNRTVAGHEATRQWREAHERMAQRASAAFQQAGGPDIGGARNITPSGPATGVYASPFTPVPLTVDQNSGQVHAGTPAPNYGSPSISANALKY